MLFRLIIIFIFLGYIVGVDLLQNGIDLKEATTSLLEIDWFERFEKTLEQREIEKDSLLYPFILSLMIGTAFLLQAALFFGLFLSQIFFIPLGDFAFILFIIVLLDAITFGILFKTLFAGFILLLEKIRILKIGGK